MLKYHDQHVIHIGELLFGRIRKPITTLLGSCVAITLWHPRQLIGGMCHFALPCRPDFHTQEGEDARYASDCIKIFMRHAHDWKVELTEFEVRLFGGGDMFTHMLPEEHLDTETVQTHPVGEANVAHAFGMLMELGISVLEADVGEKGYRKLWFDPRTGYTRVTFVPVHRVSQLDPRYMRAQA